MPPLIPGILATLCTTLAVLWLCVCAFSGGPRHRRGCAALWALSWLTLGLRYGCTATAEAAGWSRSPGSALNIAAQLLTLLSAALLVCDLTSFKPGFVIVQVVMIIPAGIDGNVG